MRMRLRRLFEDIAITEQSMLRRRAAQIYEDEKVRRSKPAILAILAHHPDGPSQSKVSCPDKGVAGKVQAVARLGPLNVHFVEAR